MLVHGPLHASARRPPAGGSPPPPTLSFLSAAKGTATSTTLPLPQDGRQTSPDPQPRADHKAPARGPPGRRLPHILARGWTAMPMAPIRDADDASATAEERRTMTKSKSTKAKKTTAPQPARKRAGRPPALQADAKTLRQIRKLAEIQCTLREAAGVLLVHENTLCTFLGPSGSKEAREAWESGCQEGRASIRRKQYEVAMRGSPTMLIWWGKNHLGQSDKIEKTETIDASISTTDVRIPAYETIADKRAQLKAFEDFRRQLQLRYPAPKQQLATDAQAEPMPAAA
jgi:hypothetical protein